MNPSKQRHTKPAHRGIIRGRHELRSPFTYMHEFEDADLDLRSTNPNTMFQLHFEMVVFVLEFTEFNLEIFKTPLNANSCSHKQP